MEQHPLWRMSKKSGCIAATQTHRTLVVREYHTLLQARRREMLTGAFKLDMHHRNGIEGTQSELIRGYGLRHARYRSLAKTSLQNYLMERHATFGNSSEGFNGKQHVLLVLWYRHRPLQQAKHDE
jgi:hypothetical protein